MSTSSSARGRPRRAAATGRSGFAQRGRATPARRSGRTCRRCEPMRRARPSSSAAPAPCLARASAGRARDARTGAGSPRPPSRSSPNCCRPTGPRPDDRPWSPRPSSLPSSRPTSSTATNVCVRLCASAPRTTMRLLLRSRGMVGPVGGHTSVGAMPRSYQVTPAGPSHRAPAKRVQISRRRQALYEPGTGCSGFQPAAIAARLTLTLRAL